MPIMRNLKLIISYDGTDFQGWQTQPGFRTVQETIQKHLEKITNQKSRFMLVAEPILEFMLLLKLQISVLILI